MSGLLKFLATIVTPCVIIVACGFTLARSYRQAQVEVVSCPQPSARVQKHCAGRSRNNYWSSNGNNYPLGAYI